MERILSPKEAELNLDGTKTPTTTECMHETYCGFGKCFGALTGALTADLLLQIEYDALLPSWSYLFLVQSRIYASWKQE